MIWHQSYVRKITIWTLKDEVSLYLISYNQSYQTLDAGEICHGLLIMMPPGSQAQGCSLESLLKPHKRLGLVAIKMGGIAEGLYGATPCIVKSREFLPVHVFYYFAI